MSLLRAGLRLPSRRFARPLLAIIALLAVSFSADPAYAAGGVVGNGSAGSCTEAAFDAIYLNAQSTGGGVITFNCGSGGATILFSYQKPVQANTELRGAGLITLSGNNARSLFQIYFGQTLTLDNMTLTRAYGPAGAVENFGKLVVKNSRLTDNIATSSGGAISSGGELNIMNSLISGNSAGDTGGAIFVDGGTATISASRFVNNTAANAGGAVRATVVSTLSIDGSTFTGNKTTGTFAQGGAVRGEGAVTITGSTFATNSGSRGGALSVGEGLTKVIRSTMTGNWAAYGGAIRQEGGQMELDDVLIDHNGYGPSGAKVTTGGGGISWGGGTGKLSGVSITRNWASYGGGLDHTLGTLELTNVTISENGAVGAGGVNTDAGSVTMTNVTLANNYAGFSAGGLRVAGGTIALKNTLLSGNFNSGDGKSWNCDKALVVASFSLSSDFTCSLGSGRDGVKLPLRPLGNNGGPTPTHLLYKGSPALDAATGLGCPPADQRGVVRPQGTACDVGAVEMRAQDLLFRLSLPMIRR